MNFIAFNLEKLQKHGSTSLAPKRMYFVTSLFLKICFLNVDQVHFRVEQRTRETDADSCFELVSSEHPDFDSCVWQTVDCIRDPILQKARSLFWCLLLGTCSLSSTAVAPSNVRSFSMISAILESFSSLLLTDTLARWKSWLHCWYSDSVRSLCATARVRNPSAAIMSKWTTVELMHVWSGASLLKITASAPLE